MKTLPSTIKRLTDFFESFPEIGPRQALRLSFWLVRHSKIKEIFKLIALDIDKVKICQDCRFIFEGEGELCDICQDPQRDKTKLCIVLTETALFSFEKAQFYNGLYFVLGNFLTSQDENFIELLKKMINKNKVQTIVFSLPLTSEGRATIKKIKDSLKEFNLNYIEPQIGLPKGGDVEFADPETLKKAFEKLL